MNGVAMALDKKVRQKCFASTGDFKILQGVVASIRSFAGARCDLFLCGGTGSELSDTDHDSNVFVRHFSRD
jgi:hypothetical protein